MGRKSTKAGAVPRLRARVRRGVTWYYYDHGGKPRKETPLGKDYGIAIKKWAEFEHESKIPAPAVITFKFVADAYMIKVAAHKAMRTFEDNKREIANLISFFDDPPCPLEAIKPVTVRQYMTWRTKKGTGYTRANREKALLSHIWNFARDEGYTDLPNPCAGIKGFKEDGRDAYIEDDQYEAIWEKGDVCVRDAMDLAFLLGQRPADVIKLAETDIRQGFIQIKQGKGDKKVRIQVEEGGELSSLLARIKERKSGFKVYSTRLIVNEKGRSIGVNAMSRRWAKACKAAKVTGLQFRDLRAKAATDKEESTGNIREAQKQLGHSNVRTTEIYLRNRRGAKVTPTK